MFIIIDKSEREREWKIIENDSLSNLTFLSGASRLSINALLSAKELIHDNRNEDITKILLTALCILRKKAHLHSFVYIYLAAHSAAIYQLYFPVYTRAARRLKITRTA